MEVIRAILSILISFLFLGIVIRIAWPLLLILVFFILFTVFRGALMSREYRKRASERHTESSQQSTSQQQQSSSNPDIIDAEFTEEELD